MMTSQRGLICSVEDDKPQRLSAIDRQVHCTGRPALTKAPSQPLRNNGRCMTQVLHEAPHVDVKVDCVPSKSSRRGPEEVADETHLECPRRGFSTSLKNARKARGPWWAR